MAQEASVAPKVSTIRQVIQIYGLAFGSSLLTKVRSMPQSFCLFNTEKERTLLVRGEETTTPQAVRHQILASQEYM